MPSNYPRQRNNGPGRSTTSVPFGKRGWAWIFSPSGENLGFCPNSLTFDAYGPIPGSSSLPTETREARPYFVHASAQAAIEAFIPDVHDQIRESYEDYNPGAYLTFVTSDNSDSMSDIVTPNYRRRSAAGEIINNPMSSSSVEMTCGTFGHETRVINFTGGLESVNTTAYLHGTLGWRTTATFDATFDITIDPFGLTSEGYDEFENICTQPTLMSPQNAINSAYGNVSQGEFDVIVFLAELNRTIALIADTIYRIYRIYRAIKSGNFSDLAPSTFRRWRDSSSAGRVNLSSSIISDAWLEARYAWRPLMIDCQQAVSLISSPRRTTPRRTFRGFDSDETHSNVILTWEDSWFLYEFSGSESITKTVRAGILTDVKLGRLQDLGALDLVGAAWDLVPFSFVVDWFINIGGMLNAINPKVSQNELATWYTAETIVEYHGGIEVTSKLTGVTKTVNFSHLARKRAREPDTSPTLLSFDLSFDALNVLDAIALLRRIL